MSIHQPPLDSEDLEQTWLQIANEEESDLEDFELSSQSGVHDRTQLETKIDFDLHTASKGLCKNYDIDLYLFLPKTLAVSQDTYSREDFYGDLTHLLRIRTPEPQAPSTQNGRSYFQPIKLESLDRYLSRHLHAAERQALVDLVVHDIKLYGCMVYSELKKVSKLLRRLVERGKSQQNPLHIERWHKVVMHRVESVHSAIRDYRQRYIWRIQNEAILTDEPVRTALLLVDEYLSYRLEGALIAITKLSEPYGAGLEDLRHQVEALLLGEVAYRQNQSRCLAAACQLAGEEQVPQREQASLENHFYRLGLLKKYVSSVLFLDVRRVHRDYLYRNFIAAFGAALAAAFATITNIQTVRMVNGNEEFGVRLLAILGLGVLAYVFKDRIKDLIKDYFNSRLKTWLPDFDVQILYTHYQPDGLNSKVKLGSSQEYMRYLESLAVPPDITFLRDTTHITELEPEEQENVIHYHKSMSFELQELKEHLAGAPVRKMHDVLRLDISHFLAKLADPQKQLSYYAPGQGIVTVDAPKVYHLNLIFRYRVTDSGEQTQSSAVVDYERLRIVLNKQGIVRVDTVFPRGELGYTHTETRSGGRYLRQFERTSSAYAPHPSNNKKTLTPK